MLLKPNKLLPFILVAQPDREIPAKGASRPPSAVPPLRTKNFGRRRRSMASMCFRRESRSKLDAWPRFLQS